MRDINETIEVHTRRNRPTLLRWRRLVDVHRVLDYWVHQGRWWVCEERRTYFLVTSSIGTLELYRSADRWVLWRLFD